jgi:hypothetical protein
MFYALCLIEYMNNYLAKVIELLRISNGESKIISFLSSFRKNNNKKSKLDKNLYLFQVPMDPYFLMISKIIITEENYNKKNIIGSWPYYIKPNKQRFFFFQIFHFIKNKLFFFFLKKKWSKIYSSINVNQIYDFSRLSFKSIFFAIKNIKKYQKIKKSDILNLKIDGILIGDLIYDTYIRYRCVPTLDYSDFFLKYIIFKSLIVFYNIEDFLKNNKNIKSYFSSYASYINHGLVIRVLLKHGVDVYILPKEYHQNFCEKLTIKKKYGSFKNYNDLYKKLKKNKNKKRIIKIAEKNLKSRFDGKFDKGLSYMKKNFYKPSVKDDFPFKGVMFLHDYYDAPKEAGLKIFNDFYDWTEFSINIIQNNNLDIALKPHPNSKPESIEFNEYLIKKYPKINFIDKDFNNNIIFNSKNFKTGISAFGSVLYELIYFNKSPLYLGNNLIEPLKIIETPNTKNEYKQLLINYDKIRINEQHKKDMLGLYYYYLNYDESFLNCKIAKKIDLKSLDSQNLSNIKTILNRLKKFN